MSDPYSYNLKPRLCVYMCKLKQLTTSLHICADAYPNSAIAVHMFISSVYNVLTLSRTIFKV